MSTITTEQVKELRDRTGISVMQCRKALEEAAGDMEKAIMILKKQSGVAAAKKGDREASAGLIVAKKEGNKAIALTLNCETDFVGKNDDFIALAKALLEKAWSEGKAAMEAAAPEMIAPVIQKIGENIKLGTVTEVESANNLGLYVHDGKLGTIVEIKGGDEALAKDLAMHISAMKPEYKTREEVPAETVAQFKEIAAKEVDTSKPADIQEKILAGKIDAYFKERTLMDQPFFKDTDKKISDVLKSGGAELVNYTSLSLV
ncbi:MAG: translation elongation factor Ts [Candidatus Pacebacteria bacterium]|nr:translation elongation factor Ts [Candidatus Paceibacterota bacterium]MBP9851893.1 translation elongation factor Ts [Candidatus Paceibacterota bacterium]